MPQEPKRNMEKKLVRSLSNGNEFVAYVDAIGHMGGHGKINEGKDHIAFSKRSGSIKSSYRPLG
jgi:hypothetical protein